MAIGQLADHIIRIGSLESQTYISGVIHGDGTGLTNVSIIGIGIVQHRQRQWRVRQFLSGDGGEHVDERFAEQRTRGARAFADSSGYANTADGWRALYQNTTGYYNTAEGAGALYLNSSGYGNTANGNQALGMNTSGSANPPMATCR